MTTTTTPYSASTGHYTVDQIEGEACTNCGAMFTSTDASRRVALGIGYQMYAHVKCPTKAATR